MELLHNYWWGIFVAFFVYAVIYDFGYQNGRKDGSTARYNNKLQNNKEPWDGHIRKYDQ